MDIVSRKKDIMGKIGALNKITENTPKFNPKNSFSSINNNNESLNFLLELANTLVGYNEIKDSVVNVISRKLPEIEIAIKKDLKKQIKDIISCNVNPTIPGWLKSDGEGINIELSNIDFFGLMKCNPNQQDGYGSVLYDDISSGINSTDFNTYLYSNIQLNKNSTTPNSGISQPWGNSTTTSEIADITYNQIGKINQTDTTNKTNIINFKVNKNFDDKKLIDFNEAYIDSISIFGKTGSDKVLSNVVDNLFGTVGNVFGKSKEQLLIESKIKKCITCILNSDETSDSFFTFSNEDLKIIEKDVNNKRKGIRALDCCKKTPVSIEPSVLLESQQKIFTSDEPTPSISAEDSRTVAVSESIDTLANAQINLTIPTVDIPTIKLNFITDLIKELVYSLFTFIISPKLMMVYSINHQLIYGKGSKYDGPIDFIKKNVNLIKALGMIILEFIIKEILELVLAYLSYKIAINFEKETRERAKLYVNMLRTLSGLPPEITNQIQNITNRIL